ncbi:MAG: PLP-dependent aminotransferase family protein [Betaproteobacteria bacterium]|nr:PLP-dependent aminotransferase family protein [Betaproteobacteria bacterium]
MTMDEKPSIFRYQEIAARLTSQIDAGVLQPNERLPSVRKLMRREHISLTTATRVLHVLEQNGRAYVRPRSGYFVRSRSSDAAWATLPAVTEKAFDGVPVAINDLVVDMLEKSATGDILPLGSAVLDSILIPQSQLSRILIATAKRGAAESACYTSPPGLFELRCGIARIMGDRGVLCGPDDIVITAGDSAAIECTLRIVARPGDSIVIETPTYFGILQAIETAGMKAIEITTDPLTGIDVDELERAVNSQHRIACVLLNPTLQNPLGYTMPTLHRKRVVELLARAGIPLIEDDVFHDLYAGRTQVDTLKSYDKNGMVLYCSSFSKVLTPGYRIGWCLPGRFLRKMMKDFLGRNISISRLPQQVLSEFLRKNYYEQHTARLRVLFAEQAQKVAALVKQHFPLGTRVSQPTGGFIYWIELADPVDMASLYARALSEGVSIAPGSVFYASGRCNNAFRICIGRKWTARVEQAIANLGKLCRRLSTRSRRETVSA